MTRCIRPAGAETAVSARPAAHGGSALGADLPPGGTDRRGRGTGLLRSGTGITGPVDAALLVVSRLMTHAVRHAAGAPRVMVTACTGAEHFVVAVGDQDPRSVGPAGPSAGEGLQTVARMTASFDGWVAVEPVADGRGETVAARFRLPSGAATSTFRESGPCGLRSLSCMPTVTTPRTRRMSQRPEHLSPGLVRPASGYAYGLLRWHLAAMLVVARMRSPAVRLSEPMPAK